jgi:hypothetical protein
VARIRETARLAAVPLEFARSPDQITSGLQASPSLVLVDLTGGFDYEAVFATLDARSLERTSVLGFTTHALARHTQPWHSRCDRVVTKETLTAELPSILRDGVARTAAAREP